MAERVFCSFEVDKGLLIQIFRPGNFNIVLHPFGGVPEWLKGTDCKSVGYAYVGSNPTPSTTVRTSFEVGGRPDEARNQKPVATPEVGYGPVRFEKNGFGGMYRAGHVARQRVFPAREYEETNLSTTVRV